LLNLQDGFPIYGPYQDTGTTATSCWQIRDYAATSVTGCSDGLRSCLLVDPYDVSKGTVSASSTGPSLSGNLMTLSGNTISSSSGIYFEDYFYNSSCGSLGDNYLNEYNGHQHDDLGFHYHVTVDAFPYLIGPKYYGCLPEGSNCPAQVMTTGENRLSTCKASIAMTMESQSCLIPFVPPNLSESSDSQSSSSDSSRFQFGWSVAVMVGGLVLCVALAIFITWLVTRKKVAPVMDVEKGNQMTAVSGVPVLKRISP